MHSRVFCVIIQWGFLLLLASTLAYCAGETYSGSKSFHQQVAIPTFVQRYRIYDSRNGQWMTDDTYNLMSQLATDSKIDSIYYRTALRAIQTEGWKQLMAKGYLLTPELLRRHPQYINFFDGVSHTPAVYLRVADILPHNPMGSWNPDVVIFMHRVTVSHLTDAQWWLGLRYIIRGGNLEGGLSSDTDFRMIYEYQNNQDGARWLNQVEEVYKWPVLRDLERLGYNPSTILEDVHTFDQAVPSHVYSSLTSSDINSILGNAKLYFGQFDSAGGETYFKQYSQMRASIDSTKASVSWFQAPIFVEYIPAQRTYKLLQYGIGDKEQAYLDKIQYKTSINSEGRSVLVPEAIIRPVRIIPALAFKTVFKFSHEVQENERTLPFRYLQSLDALVHVGPTKVRKPGDGPSNGLIFGKERPIGHPFNLALFDPHRSTRVDTKAWSEGGSENSVFQVDVDSTRDKLSSTVGETIHSDPNAQSADEFWPSISRNDAQAEPWEVYRMQHQVQSPAHVEPSVAMQGRGKRPYEASPFTPDGPLREHPSAPVPMNIDRGLLQHLVPVPTKPRSSNLHAYQGHESHAVQPVAPQSVSPSQPQPHSQYHYQHEYKLGEENPYEIPRENFGGDFVDVLTKHFKPELEDKWRYLHRM